MATADAPVLPCYDVEHIRLDVFNFVVTCEWVPEDDGATTPFVLRKVVQSLRQFGVQYYPNVFCASQLRLMRLSEPNSNCTVMFFEQGKCVCTGGNNLRNIERNLQDVRALLRARGARVNIANVSICNIVFRAQTPFGIDLNRLQACGQHNVLYTPQVFPGATVLVRAQDLFERGFFEGDDAFEAAEAAELARVEALLQRAGAAMDSGEQDAEAMDALVERRRDMLRRLGATDLFVQSITYETLALERSIMARFSSDARVRTSRGVKADNSYCVLVFDTGQLVLPGASSFEEARRVLRSVICAARRAYVIEHAGTRHTRFDLRRPPHIVLGQSVANKLNPEDRRALRLQRLQQAAHILNLPIGELRIPDAEAVHSRKQRAAAAAAASTRKRTRRGTGKTT